MPEADQGQVDSEMSERIVALVDRLHRAANGLRNTVAAAWVSHARVVFLS